MSWLFNVFDKPVHTGVAIGTTLLGVALDAVLGLIHFIGIVITSPTTWEVAVGVWIGGTWLIPKLVAAFGRTQTARGASV